MALLFVVGAAGVCSIEGLSTDTKPAPTNLFTFYETDTGKSYLADGAAWNDVLNADYATSTHVHSAANITSSTFASARLGGGAAASTNFLRGDLSWEIPSAGSVDWGAIGGELSTQADIYGEVTSRQLIATLSSAAFTLSTIYATSTHFHSASAVTTSTFALARLGSGTTNISTFFSGNSTFIQPSFSSLANMPTLGTAASTAAADYASSTHNISSATHTFPGGTVNFLRADGTFAAPPAGSSNISTVRTTTLRFSTTTSTFAMTELAFTVSSTVNYAFEFGVVFATTISSTGIRLGLQFPAVSTFGAVVDIPIAAAGTAASVRGWVTSNGASVVGTAVQAASTKYFADIYGAILPSANGTLQVVYATEIAASAVSTFAGSYGILTTL